MNRPNCEAYQCGDSMYCDKCAVNWDTNDPEPPECKTDTPRPVNEPTKVDNVEAKKRFNELREILDDE